MKIIKRLVLILMFMCLAGCSRNKIESISFKPVYPYRIVINTPLTELGSQNIQLINESTFIIDDNKFTMNNGKITQIDLPDRTINSITLKDWKTNQEENYLRYKDSLEKANAYAELAESIKKLDFTPINKLYSFESKEKAYQDKKCRVLYYKETGELGINILKILGASTDKLTKDNPVYITYYIDKYNQVVYIGCNASNAVKASNGEDYQDLVLEIYTGIEN